MSTLDKICTLLEQKGKKQKDLTDFLGISKNSFTDWKSGRIKSYNKHLPKIAEFLGVSTDYLLGVENKKASADNSEGDKNTIKIAGRDGSLVERTLTDEQLDLFKKMIEQMPDADNL